MLCIVYSTSYSTKVFWRSFAYIDIHVLQCNVLFLYVAFMTLREVAVFMI